MTSDKTNRINIFINTDDNYAIPAYITLFSLIKNYHGISNVDIYVLTSNDVSLKNRKLLKSLPNHNDKFAIFIIDMNEEYSDVSINIDHISNAAMYRLMIPHIVKQLDLNIDQCIYLDTDLVVEGDISELYDLGLKLDKYYCAGVLDPCQFEDKYINYERKLGIPSMDRYINSGVMLLNLEQMNDDKISSKLEEAGYRNDFLHNDQDAINYVCYEGIKLIPLRFNIMRQLLYHDDKYIYDRYGIKDVEDAKMNPVIFHFIDRQKPWSNKAILMADKWWKYVRMQDKEIIREYIKPFAASHKAPLSEIITEAIKTVLTHMGIYDSVSNISRKITK